MEAAIDAPKARPESSFHQQVERRFPGLLQSIFFDPEIYAWMWRTREGTRGVSLTENAACEAALDSVNLHLAW